ncbi:MAG: histidine kinase [Leptolyngbya sp.]|nr:histidine kinase [Candidatus Melainabacteria bacterium]
MESTSETPENRPYAKWLEGNAESGEVTLTGIDLYYFTVCAFLIVVFTATVYLSFKGRTLARYFLWSWALLLLVAVPFISFIPDTVTTHAAGLGLLFFLYTIFLFDKRSRHQLDTAQNEIRRLLAESNNRMDEERRMIAHQLHDDINPRLVLAKLELQQLFSIIDENIEDDEQARKARTIVEKIMESITIAYQDSREIIKNTRIEIIDSIGLVAAIESLITHYKGIFERPKIKLKHNLPKRPDLPAGVAVNVYRIIQEALLNAVKHAGASNITISIFRTGHRFDVYIADDGVGISTKNAEGIGLIDMRERAKVLGSDLQTGNSGGKGTEIRFSFSHPDLSSQT